MRSMTNSTARVACEALSTGGQTFPTHGSRTSTRVFTQTRLFTSLVLRQSLRTDYHSLVTLVAGWQDPQEIPGLRKVPHHSTPAYAARCLLPKGEKGGSSPVLRWSC